MTRDTPLSRRDVLRRGALVTGTALAGLATAGGAAAAPGKPDFGPRVYADGDAWGTKVTGEIRHPNENSLDGFYVLTVAEGVDASLPDGQLPVSDAAPGRPGYNGGRWATHTATWTAAGLAVHGSPLPRLTRFGPASDPESILFHANLGHIDLSTGSPPGGPPDYFRCPLLPLKED